MANLLVFVQSTHTRAVAHSLFSTVSREIMIRILGKLHKGLPRIMTSTQKFVCGIVYFYELFSETIHELTACTGLQAGKRALMQRRENAKKKRSAWSDLLVLPGRSGGECGSNARIFFKHACWKMLTLKQSFTKNLLQNLCKTPDSRLKM